MPGFENALSQAVESILTITLVTEDDSGQYRCVAVSDSGIAELEIPYIVIVDPSLAVTEGEYSAYIENLRRVLYGYSYRRMYFYTS